MTSLRRRLDTDLVRRGLAESREQARADIAAGRVLVGGAVADKPARLVAPGDPVRVMEPPRRFLGRGGDKLDAALTEFGISAAGLVVLDAGASTGGFTDCLLQHGAAHVFAVDVGHGQLHQRLREDARVTVVERTNVRRLRRADLGLERAGLPLVVADLSFISLADVASVLVSLAAPGGDLVVLVKPQFEAGRAEASRGRGVISDPTVWARTIAEVRAAYEGLGATMIGLMPSPLSGAKGNIEFFAHFAAPSPDTAPVPSSPVEIDEVVAAASVRFRSVAP